MRPILLAAAMIGAVSVLTSTDAAAQCRKNVNPAAERTPLAPPSEPTAVQGHKPQRPPAAQPSDARSTDPAADAAALTMKLDYERYAGTPGRSERPPAATAGLGRKTVKVAGRTRPLQVPAALPGRTKDVHSAAGRAPHTATGSWLRIQDSSLNAAGGAPSPRACRRRLASSSTMNGNAIDTLK